MLASAAVALRARTGSARLETVSLDERILEMELENAVGSLRLRVRLLRAADEPEDDDDADAELRSEAEEETLGEGLLARGDLREVEGSGEATSVEGNSSARGEEGEGLV